MEAAFYILSTLSVLAGILVVLNRNPVYSAVCLAVTFFGLAGLFLLLEAYFVAAIQVLVYAGAILVLFLFVIMLLNLPVPKREYPKLSLLHVSAVALSYILLFQLLVFISKREFTGVPRQLTQAQHTEFTLNNVQALGELLFTKYLLPFEAASILLLIGMVGVIILAKRKLD